MKLAGGLSEAKPSCRLPVSAFSIVPDFVVILASWSGAEASHIIELNTSSITALHCFRPFSQSAGSPANTDFIILAFLPIGHQPYHSRACMCPDTRAYIIDDDICKTKLFHHICHTLCLIIAHSLPHHSSHRGARTPACLFHNGPGPGMPPFGSPEF